MNALVSSQCLLLSTSDLSAVDIPARLCSPSSTTLGACLATLTCSPRMLVTPRDDITPVDVVLSELLNPRGPVAWLTTAHDGSGSSGGGGGELLQLALDCATLNTVLVLNGAEFDLVLVPRPACTEDGVPFVCFATRVEGVRFIAQTIAARKVAVLLDLDATLLESEHLPVQPLGWDDLPWQAVPLTQEPSGQAVTGHICRLPDEPHHAESVHGASWVWKGAAHNYRVRQRLGWAHLRDLLIQEGGEGGRLDTHVLSLGRPLYIQSIWQILDPAGAIIPVHEFGRKVNSARPDGVFWVPEKTPCIGVGLRDVFARDFNMRLGPTFIADDLPEVYAEKHRDAVYEVQAYKPVCAQPTDYDADGSTLRRMADSLMGFWRYCYGADGAGGAVAAATAAARGVLAQLASTPLPEDAAGGPWGQQLFSAHPDISASLLVQSFLKAQLNAGQPPTPIEAAVPDAEPAVPEPSENRQTPGKGAATPTVRPASPVQPLRPSSRQDHRADALHLPSKPGAQLPSPHSAACAEDGDSTASVRIVPASQGADGESRLVVVLGSAPAPVPVPAPASQSAEQVALVVGACCTAVEVASGMDGAGAAAAALEAELDLGGLGLLCGEGSASRASLQELEVEDAQAELELGGAAAQDGAVGECASAGRKRDFASIAEEAEEVPLQSEAATPMVAAAVV